MGAAKEMYAVMRCLEFDRFQIGELTRKYILRSITLYSNTQVHLEHDMCLNGTY